jgi:hypothetical protein
LEAMAQMMMGTSRIRPSVMRLGMLFGILTRRFPAQKIRPRGG